MKLSKTQKNILKPILIFSSIVYLPCAILGDFIGSLLGLTKYGRLGKESFFDKLGNEVFS